MPTEQPVDSRSKPRRRRRLPRHMARQQSVVLDARSRTRAAVGGRLYWRVCPASWGAKQAHERSRAGLHSRAARSRTGRLHDGTQPPGLLPSSRRRYVVVTAGDEWSADALATSGTSPSGTAAGARRRADRARPVYHGIPAVRSRSPVSIASRTKEHRAWKRVEERATIRPVVDVLLDQGQDRTRLESTRSSRCVLVRRGGDQYAPGRSCAGSASRGYLQEMTIGWFTPRPFG